MEFENLKQINLLLKLPKSFDYYNSRERHEICARENHIIITWIWYIIE